MAPHPRPTPRRGPTCPHPGLIYFPASRLSARRPTPTRRRPMGRCALSVAWWLVLQAALVLFLFLLWLAWQTQKKTTPRNGCASWLASRCRRRRCKSTTPRSGCSSWSACRRRRRHRRCKSTTPRSGYTSCSVSPQCRRRRRLLCPCRRRQQQSMLRLSGCGHLGESVLAQGRRLHRRNVRGAEVNAVLEQARGMLCCQPSPCSRIAGLLRSSSTPLLQAWLLHSLGMRLMHHHNKAASLGLFCATCRT